MWWSDLGLVVDFFLSLMTGIVSVVMNSILVTSVGLSILALVIRIFKRIL